MVVTPKQHVTTTPCVHDSTLADATDTWCSKGGGSEDSSEGSGGGYGGYGAAGGGGDGGGGSGEDDGESGSERNNTHHLLIGKRLGRWRREGGGSECSDERVGEGALAAVALAGDLASGLAALPSPR